MANDSPQSEQAAPLQAIADEYAVQQQPPGLEKEYETGLHDDLKSGIEKLSGFAINGDVLLEREADVMGAKALQPGYSSPNTSEVPEALNATIVQRKHADLGYAELDEILEQKLKDKIVRYNQSTLLSTLQGQPQRDQAGKDVLLLDVILSDLGDYFDKYPNNKQLLSFYQTTYAHQSGAKDIRDAPETEVSEVHTVHFTGFPKIKKPEHKQKVFSGVEYIEATINQKNCRLYAFQDYLNTEYSTQLWDKPPEKGGTIPLMKIFSPEEEEANYENWAVTDAHHRFVWRAHHGQKVEVTLGKFNVPKSDAHAWSELTYVHDPKQSYQFKADDKWATEAFHAAISPLFPYSGWFKDDPEAFITYTLKHIHRLGEDLFIEEPNITRLKSYISGKLQVAEVNTYREAVKKLVGSARDKESAEAKAAIL
ncbi:MAG: hypothetical protein HKN34_03305, partial [Gammaproteobacteria bacterium]|nr:hypothetical protein [Gammaproteobacteria bacterium]